MRAWSGLRTTSLSGEVERKWSSSVESRRSVRALFAAVLEAGGDGYGHVHRAGPLDFDDAVAVFALLRRDLVRDVGGRSHPGFEEPVEVQSALGFRGPLEIAPAEPVSGVVAENAAIDGVEHLAADHGFERVQHRDALAVFDDVVEVPIDEGLLLAGDVDGGVAALEDSRTEVRFEIAGAGDVARAAVLLVGANAHADH